MKLHHLILTASLLSFPACEKKQTTSEKIENKIDDALDQRPGEKILDAVENSEDAIKDAADDVKEAVEDTTK